MKNILLLNHHASIPKYGGGGRHHEFACELSKRNFNVCLIASSYQHGSEKYLHEASIIEENINEKYKFIMLKTKPNYKKDIKKRLLNYFDFSRRLQRIKLEFKPDVIVASSVHPLTWVAGYKLALKHNAKFVVEVRDLWPLTLYEDLNPIIRPFTFMFFNCLERKYYNLASSIIVTAPNVNRYMKERYKINKEKVHFVPHSIDIVDFDRNITREVNEKIKRLLEGYFCITYTGALSKSEGLENFLYLANRFKDCKAMKFIIIGSGTEKDKLQTMIKSMNLENVLMFDRLPRENIPSILSKSSVLFAGLIERKAFKYGISKNKFYDYMAANKPVLFMSNVEDSAIEKAKCGYVVRDHSIDEAEIKLKKIYEDENLYKTLSDRGREYVENHHTIGTITDKFLKAIT